MHRQKSLTHQTNLEPPRAIVKRFVEIFFFLWSFQRHVEMSTSLASTVQLRLVGTTSTGEIGTTD